MTAAQDGLGSIDGGKATVTLTNAMGQAQDDLAKVTMQPKHTNARASKYAAGHAVTNPEKLTAAHFGLTPAAMAAAELQKAADPNYGQKQAEADDDDDDDDFEIDDTMPDEQDRLPEDDWK